MAPGHDPRPDVELVDQLRSGDGSAEAALWARHQESAVRIAAWRLRAVPDADAHHAATRAFERLIEALRAGSGPVEAVRPALLTAVSRTAASLGRGQNPDGDPFELFGAGDAEAAPVMAGPDARLLSQAFLALPERGQTVLWHLEVEREDPSKLGWLLASSPETVELLADGARQELRAGFLALHAGEAARSECLFATDLPGYVRGDLGRRAHRRFQDHAGRCPSCAASQAHLQDLGAAMRQIIGPLFVGRDSTACFGLAAPAAAPFFRSRPVLVGTGIAAAAALVLSSGALASAWMGDAPVGRTAAAVAAVTPAAPGPVQAVPNGTTNVDAGASSAEPEHADPTASSASGSEGTGTTTPSPASAPGATANTSSTGPSSAPGGGDAAIGAAGLSRPGPQGGLAPTAPNTVPPARPTSEHTDQRQPDEGPTATPSPTAPARTAAPAPSPTPTPEEPAPAKPTPEPTPSSSPTPAPTPSEETTPPAEDEDCLIDLLGIRVCR